jgi:16S rRNA (adenine1518-N6/adenine1519-N6)-dimethyltransferase
MTNNFIPAKKSLGQNFLKSKLALFKMIEAGEVNDTDTILEVGPGKGALTEKLLTVAKKIIAVEKDDRLIELLQERFAIEISQNKLEIIHADILDFKVEDNLDTTAPSSECHPTLTKAGKIRYKIIANIPYYITGQFLRKFLADGPQPERIVVMVQKEIADRIVAREGKESLLSLSVKAFGEPKKIMKIEKENFSPAPKVDSAILAITNINKNNFSNNKELENNFFTLIKAGFASKRKILSSNLKKILPPEKIATLKTNIRAEDLKLEEWLELLK